MTDRDTNETVEAPTADAGAAAQEETDRRVEAVQAAGDAKPRDRVFIPSLSKDGSPDQTENFELIGDPEVTKSVVTEQLREQRVSAVDDAARSALAAGTSAEEAPQDPVVQALTDLHEKAAGGVERDADRLVKNRHAGA